MSLFLSLTLSFSLSLSLSIYIYLYIMHVYIYKTRAERGDLNENLVPNLDEICLQQWTGWYGGNEFTCVQICNTCIETSLTS